MAFLFGSTPHFVKLLNKLLYRQTWIFGAVVLLGLLTLAHSLVKLLKILAHLAKLDYPQFEEPRSVFKMAL